MRAISAERLKKIWDHPRWTVEECAAILMISEEEIRALAKRHGLRHRRRLEEECPPSAAEIAEREQRAADIRAAHLHLRRTESGRSSSSKVRKWAAGQQPRGAHHIV